MVKCQFCNSQKTKLLNEVLFCESCEIYFSLKNGNQLIKSLPIVETDQRMLSFCPPCSRKFEQEIFIKCKRFQEYFKQLPYCANCKSSNAVFLKNLFFKNFLLYKKIDRVFGFRTLLLLLFVWVYIEECIPLMHLYISMTLGEIQFLRLLVQAFIFYQTSQYSFVNAMLFLMCLYKIITKKSMYFKVPTNLLSAHELDTFIDRLNINTSFDRDIYKHKAKKNLKFGSQPTLKSKL